VANLFERLNKAPKEAVGPRVNSCPQRYQEARYCSRSFHRPTTDRRQSKNASTGW
jgi:hypothetical protein